MGTEFLIYTNVVIASLANKLPQEAVAFVTTLPPAISVITQIELLGWYHVSAADLASLTAFVERSFVYPITPAITNQCILPRQNFKIKTPDALIAATSIVHGLTLLTRNTADFKKVDGLKLLNPFELDDTFGIDFSAY
jgi:predicted nucleic acid-binding protein